MSAFVRGLLRLRRGPWEVVATILIAFGVYRLEILAAFVNALLLFAVAVWVLFEAPAVEPGDIFGFEAVEVEFLQPWLGLHTLQADTVGQRAQDGDAAAEEGVDIIDVTPLRLFRADRIGRCRSVNIRNAQ